MDFFLYIACTLLAFVFLSSLIAIKPIFPFLRIKPATKVEEWTKNWSNYILPWMQYLCIVKRYLKIFILLTASAHWCFYVCIHLNDNTRFWMHFFHFDLNTEENNRSKGSCIRQIEQTSRSWANNNAKLTTYVILTLKKMKFFRCVLFFTIYNLSVAKLNKIEWRLYTQI